jgi:hypothetical protein
MQVFTKEEMRQVLFASCDALDLANLPKHWIEFFEEAYARRNELPFDLDANITDEYVFEMQNLASAILPFVTDEKTLYELVDIGTFFLYLWWKKNCDEFSEEI